MIKINLATRKQSGLVGGEARGPKLGGLIGGANLEQLKGLPIRKFGAAALVALIASYGLDSYKQSLLQEADLVLKKQEARNENISNEVKKFQEYEAIKKSVDADELLVRTKLEVIRKLIADKGDIAKFLYALSNMIPKEVWLNSLNVDKLEVAFRGSALDFNQVSDFMKILKDSAFFSSIDFKGTQQEKSQQGADTADFQLVGKRR